MKQKSRSNIPWNNYIMKKFGKSIFNNILLLHNGMKRRLYNISKEKNGREGS